MRVLEKVSEFASWRWAPTITLIGATLVYIAVVLLLVPEEVGIPGSGVKFTPRGTLQRGGAADAETGLDLTNTIPSFPDPGAAPVSPPPAPPSPIAPAPNFGRRGFSPPLERPEPPPAPEPAPSPVNVDPPPPPPPQDAPTPAEAPAQQEAASEPLPAPALEPAPAEAASAEAEAEPATE